MSDLNTEILISANAEGVEAGVGRAKKSLSSLGDTAQKIGKNGADGMQALGAGADMSARKVESATKNMVGSLQRQIAAMEAGDKTSRKYQETLARMRGVDVAALKPYLDQLDSLQNKTTLVARAQTSLNAVMLKGAAAFAVAGAIAGYVKMINDGVDALNDLKDATGASIENISALEDVGKRAGASFDVVSTSLIKFNNVLSDAKPGSAAEQAIKALGLSIEDLKRLDPAEALRQTSVALNRFADDGDKARLVQELFGKSVKEVAPFLKDLAESGALVAKVTTEQAEQAEKFNKELFNLEKSALDVGRALAGPLVTSMNEVIAKFKEGREAGKGFLEIASSRYWSNIREFYGMTPPAAPSSGGATGSWGDGPDSKPSVGPPKPPKPNKPTGPTKAELSEYDKLVQKLGVDLPKAAAEAEAAQMGYNKAQAEFLALAGSDVWAKFTNSQRANVAALFENKIASEQAGDAARTLSKANTEAAQARERYLASLETGVDKLKADIAAQQEATARMGLTKDAIAALDGAKLEMLATDLELQAIKALDRNLDQQTYDSLKEQASLYRDLAAAKKDGAAKEIALDLQKANEDAAKDAAKEWERAADDINRSLTDALLRGFESGKGFAENLRDTLKNMFNTLVLRPIISAALSPISGGIQGLMGGVGGVGGSNPIGMASNAYSLYNTGSQAWTLGSQYLSGSMSGANALGSVYANATGGGLDALLATNGAYGTAGGGAAGGGLSGLAGAGAFAAVAGVVLNALGAFKSERKNGGGLMGTLGSGDISPWEEWREGGTLFSGPSFSTMNPVAELERQRTKLADLRASGGGDTQQAATLQTIIDNLEANYGGLAEATAAQSKVIQSAFDAMRKSAGDMADTLGLSSEAARKFTTSLGGEKGLALDGLKPEEQQAKLAEALATANNEIAQQLIGTWETTTTEISRIVSDNIGSAGEDMSIVYSTLTDSITKTRYVASEYAKDGEKAIDTLTRLATSMQVVNETADALGYGMADASIAAAAAASNIVDAFGGLEAFTQTLGTYFSNFYSDTEQKAATARQVSRALGEFGLEIDPSVLQNATRPAIRAFVESVGEQFGYESKEYVAAIQQANVLAGITDALPSTVQAIDTAAQSASDAAQDAARAWQDITDALLGERSDAEIELLRAQGKEEAALAAERARSIVGYDAYQVSLYDGTQAIFRQIEALEKQAEAAEEAREKALELAKALSSELPGVLDKFRTPEQRTEAQYGSIANDLITAGLSGLGVDQLTQALVGAGKDDIAQAAVAIYNMTGVTDEMRLALVRAAGGLADLKDQANALNLQNAQSATDAAFSALQREVDARRTVLQETIADVRSVFNAVGDASRALMGEVESTSAMMGRQGRDFLTNALSNAQTTGYLPDPADLDQAISAAVGDLGKQVFATQFDADRERLLLAGTLAGLEDISGEQLTEAEEQLKVLDGVLETARQQVDVLRGIDTSIMGVDARIALLATAILTEQGARAAAKPGGGGGGGRPGAGGNPLPGWANFGVGDWVVNSSGSLVADATTGNIVGPGGIQGQRSTIVREATALLEAGQSMAVYDAIKASGFTLEQADKVLGLGAGTAEDWAKAMGLPIFHNGTSYVPQTGLALLERGEAVIPKAFNPAANQGMSVGSERLEGLVVQLVDDNRRQAGEIIRLTNQMAKVLSKWDDEGQPEEREAVTA